MASALDDALAVRDVVTNLGIDIYDSVAPHPQALYTRDQLEALLSAELVGEVFAGPLRTRSKITKQAVCLALGYPVPASFTRVKPRFPGQDLDVYVQERDNVQVWNEDLSPTRRYALIRVDHAGKTLAVRVVDGIQLTVLDKTGKLTRKYQAKRRTGRSGSTLVSDADTPALCDVLAPVDALPNTVLGSLLPINPPEKGKVLTVAGLHKRLLALVGQEFEYSTSERVRGERLHRAACAALGLGSYADTGKFPDIVCQALEVKLQTADTIDLARIVHEAVAAPMVGAA